MTNSADLKPVQLANFGDAANIVELVNASYRGETSKRGWTTEADLLGGQRTDLNAIEDIIRDPHSVLLTLRNKDTSELLACVQLEKKNSTIAYLGMLTVSPQLQAAGLGRFLLKAAEDYVHKEWGSREVEMTVISHRVELIQWYQRRGYEVIPGERRPFPSHDPRFGIPKREDLDFVVLKKHLKNI
ncbi:MAG: GNAT family N-acetyltransferase [Bdellovibrionota bacterium]